MSADALLAAILASPDDELPRLAYADWLEERGDPRAEYVRLNVEFRGRSLMPGRWEEIRSRLRELEAAHLGTWLAPFQPFDPDRVEPDFDGVGPVSITITGGTKADLDVLRRTPGVGLLRLEDCRLTPDALRLVAGLRHLDGLTITDTRIDRAGLELLDGLPPWTVVRISDEGFSEEDWAEFQQRRIDRIAGLEPEQRRNAALRFLKGLDSHIRHDGKTAALSQMSATDAEMRFLSWLPELEEVCIDETRAVTTAGLKHLSGLTRLKSLIIAKTEVDSLTPITGCVALERLEFYPDHDVTVTDAGTAGLERLTNLESLSLQSDELADETVKRIGSLVRLKELSLEVGPLNDPECMAALGRLRSLERLSLSGGSEYSDHVLRHLAGLANLETLSMSVSGDGDNLRHLRGLMRLRRLYLSGEGVRDTGIRHLTTLTALRSFMAQGSAVTAAGAREMAAQLPGVTIILDQDVVKSPRPTLTFRRRCLGGFVSALFPSHWNDWGYGSDGRIIGLVEDGWEAVGGWSGGIVGPVEIRLQLSAGIPAGGVTGERDRWVTNNSHMSPRVVSWTADSLDGAEDEASCIYRYGNSQCLICVATAAGRLVVFNGQAPSSRFDEFLSLFRFIAGSVRIGEQADHSAEEAVIAASELA
jgi:uncharacterized protein (TIGR02996 family)